MRAFRTAALLGAALAGSAMLASPAAADGGAYLDLDRTHYLPGQTAIARTYVTVPRNKQGLLQSGPFFAYLVTGRAWPQEGRPIPADAIRVGIFTIEHDAGSTFELKARVAIPDVVGDYYSLALCNDPCTLTGFREPISGPISIVQTAREAQLLDENRRMAGRLNHAQHLFHKQGKELETLQTDFRAREQDRAYLAAEVNRLHHALDAARSASSDRPLLGGWTIAVALAILAAAIAARAFRRRRHPAAVVAPTA